MLCISVSYKKTAAKLRQKFSFSETEQKEFLRLLMENDIISGGVILSTCNRSELYATVNHREGNEGVIGFLDAEGGRSLEKMEEYLSEYKGLSHNEIRRNCLFYQGRQAVTHLYKVVCGLDSMVLGEDEILRQAKEAYQSSKNIGAADGELNILFQGAFHCAKLSKAKTRISETPVSIGTLTANYVEEFLMKQEASGTTPPRSVLVIGAGGQIGSIVAKDLIAKKIPVIGTTRSHAAAGDPWRCGEMTWIDFNERYRCLGQISAVVSATKSPHYTLTRNEFVESRAAGHTVLLVDLAVPYDIDRDLEEEKGVCLLGIDHFKELSERNSTLKLGEAEKMAGIVKECVEEALKRLYTRNFQALMPEHEAWFSKMLSYLKDSLDSDTLLHVLDTIYKKG